MKDHENIKKFDFSLFKIHNQIFFIHNKKILNMKKNH